MPELLLTLDSIHKMERRKQKFMAALQGVDIDKDDKKESTKKNAATIEDVKARAIARLTGDMNAAGAAAEGITPDQGINYKIMGGSEIG